MRISTAYLTQRGLNGMLEQQNRLAQIQEQVSSGKRLLKPSDDPTGSAQILRLEQALSVTDQYQRNAGNALNRLTLEESTLDNVQNSLIRIRELAIQGNNSTLGNTDRLAIAQEVRERLNELVSLANTKDANQEYLFSGYKVTTKPFSQAANGTFNYSGDQGQRALQISSGRNINDSDSGNNVFVNIKNGNGTFQTNLKAGNIVSPGIYTAAVSDGTPASPTENTVTAIAGTDGGGGGEQFILTIDGAPAVDVTFGAGDTVATPAVAAELDSDLATFIAGSGGAYSITSGSLSGGNLVLSKADGTAITFDTSTSTLTGVAANVTESQTTAGTPAVAPTDTAFTMSIDGTQFFTEAAAIGGTVTAGELDAALTAFVAGSGGAYTINSGSIAAGNLLLSKADGTSVALTIDSNFSATAGSFSGALASSNGTPAVTANIWDTYTYIDGAVAGGPDTLAFSTAGAITTPASGTITTPAFAIAGAANIALTQDYSATTQYGSAFSVNALAQDGYTTGRLSGLDIDAQGIIFARFTNGQSAVQGQIALADFRNPQGLQPVSDTSWGETFSSGSVTVGAPGTASLGLLQAGALEQSNVDLSEELVNMIIAQRSFQANAEVISTSDTVTQSIINLR